MSQVSQRMPRVSQRIASSDLESNFFRAGDEISASEAVLADENDHDSWRQPAPRFSLKRSLLAIVTLPVAVVRHFRAPRQELDLELDVELTAIARAVTGQVQRMSGRVQRMSGQVQRMSGQIQRMATGRVTFVDKR